jgi:hypothetical protein
MSKSIKYKSFISLDNFNMDRGTVYIVRNDRYREDGDFNDLYPEIMIDGKLMRLKGVETHATPFISEGQTIGLLCERASKNEKGQGQKG